MTTKLVTRVLTISVVGLSLLTAGCATRGNFTAESCDTKQAVPAEAVSAIYFDRMGNPVGTLAEDLTGTSDNQMCPTQESNGPGTCPVGYCPLTVAGRTYCLRCS